jgi:hypothetical protein
VERRLADQGGVQRGPVAADRGLVEGDRQAVVVGPQAGALSVRELEPLGVRGDRVAGADRRPVPLQVVDAEPGAVDGQRGDTGAGQPDGEHLRPP